MVEAMRHAIVTAVLLSAVLALVSACEDDPTVPEGPIAPDSTGTLRGTYLFASDARAYGPAPVDLFDLTDLAVVARTVADTNGVFVFDGIEPGFYVPVLTSDTVAPFALPRPRYVFTRAERYDDVILVAPIPGGLTPGDDGITGTVVDEETGEPVPFARIEMNSPTGAASWFQSSTNGSELRGHTSAQEVTADSTGRFEIVPVPLVQLPVNEDPPLFETRVPSWRVVAPGYRSATFPSVEFSPGVQTFEVQLVRGADDAEITGRVVGPDGQPRSGVRVVAEWRRAPGELFRGGTSGGAAAAGAATGDPADVLVGVDGISGPDGRFRLRELPPGAYVVLAGAPGDDGWVGLDPIQGLDLNGTEDVGDMTVAPAIEFTDLDRTFTVGDTLRWTAVDGAATYRLTARRGLDLQGANAVPDTNLAVFDFADPPFDADTVLRLEAEARDAEGTLLSTTDRPHTIRWTASPPADPDL